jgi:hypothetical protein
MTALLLRRRARRYRHAVCPLKRISKAVCGTRHSLFAKLRGHWLWITHISAEQKESSEASLAKKRLDSHLTGQLYRHMHMGFVP